MPLSNNNTVILWHLKLQDFNAIKGQRIFLDDARAFFWLYKLIKGYTSEPSEFPLLTSYGTISRHIYVTQSKFQQFQFNGKHQGQFTLYRSYINQCFASKPNDCVLKFILCDKAASDVFKLALGYICNRSCMLLQQLHYCYVLSYSYLSQPQLAFLWLANIDAMSPIWVTWILVTHTFPSFKHWSSIDFFNMSWHRWITSNWLKKCKVGYVDLQILTKSSWVYSYLWLMLRKCNKFSCGSPRL